MHSYPRVLLTAIHPPESRRYGLVSMTGRLSRVPAIDADRLTPPGAAGTSGLWGKVAILPEV